MSRSRPARRLATAAVLFLITAAAVPAGAAPGGPYRPPVAGTRVVEPFAPPAERWLTGHRGVDLVAPAGTAVLAAGAGVVVFAGRLADRGVVSVDHGPLRTTYEPVDAVVQSGDRVAVGDVLGTVGEGAHCSQRCLHWGARIGEEYIDPLALLSDYRPVLKTPV